MKSRCIQEKASALVITLAFVVLMTILVVGLMDTARTERASAHSNLDALQAEFYAQAAVERVLGTLQQQTAPQQSGINTVYNWISQPGQLIVANGTSNEKPCTIVPLSSGSADPTLSGTGATGPAYLLQPDLNIPTFRSSSTHLVTEQADVSNQVISMPVAWIYVRKSGKLDRRLRPNTTDTADPIVGRYAYWTDDEGSKINYNLAWGRTGNSAPTGDPSQITLAALQPYVAGTNGAGYTTTFSQTSADALHHYINSTGSFFNTPQDARRVSNTASAGLTDALEQYKFELTHYNADPDRTFFNEPRIVLTTKAVNVPKKSDGKPFPYLNILKDENGDSGDLNNINTSNFKDVLNKLTASGTGYLTRTDWPMAPGSSFQQKYYNGVQNRLTQLAINIIDYVRCKESNMPVVPPTRGYWDSNGAWVLSASADQYAYIGVSRVPCINEVGVWLPSTGGHLTVVMEVYLPPKYNIPSIDLTKYKIWTQINGKQPVSEPLIQASELNPPGLLYSGSYQTITHVDLSPYTAAASPRPTSVKLRVGLSNSSGTRLELVPLIDVNGNGVQVQIDIPSVAISDIQSMEANDPRVNKYATDWLPCASTSGSNTFRRPNSRYLKNDVSNSGPQQDTDSDGKLSDASLYMPPPNTSGSATVTSIGELGYIHTGVQSALTNGIPWRTIRLQPSVDPVGAVPAVTVPDWALMDLFTVPITVPSVSKAIFQPNGNSFGGRVNVNSHVQPFNVKRILPLAAVLQGAPYLSATSASATEPTLSSGSAQAIAQNIYDRSLAKNGKLYGFEDGYFSPGEIAEVAGVADSGEASEELVRQVSNLVSARGNVFSVFSVGESIKQTPSGDLVVTGQKRIQAMVERYVYDAAGNVRFRTVYYRNLMP